MLKRAETLRRRGKLTGAEYAALAVGAIMDSAHPGWRSRRDAGTAAEPITWSQYITDADNAVYGETIGWVGPTERDSAFGDYANATTNLQATLLGRARSMEDTRRGLEWDDRADAILSDARWRLRRVGRMTEAVERWWGESDRRVPRVLRFLVWATSTVLAFLLGRATG